MLLCANETSQHINILNTSIKLLEKPLPVLVCERLGLSKMLLLHPIIMQSPVTNCASHAIYMSLDLLATYVCVCVNTQLHDIMFVSQVLYCTA